MAECLDKNIDNPKKNSEFVVVSKEGVKTLDDEEVAALFDGIEKE